MGEQANTKVLIIGATGNFGGSVLRELNERGGYELSALVRPGGSPLEYDELRIVEGDATNRDDLLRATHEIDVLVYGYNVPYDKWGRNLVLAARTLAEVASQRGIMIVYPGNVYGLDPGQPGPIDESGLLRAPTKKGKLRNEIELILHESTQNGASLLIVRAGDFFGPNSANTWFSFMTQKALTGGPLITPEPSDVKHTWAYLPDLSRSIVDLIGSRKKLVC